MSTTTSSSIPIEPGVATVVAPKPIIHAVSCRCDTCFAQVSDRLRLAEVQKQHVTLIGISVAEKQITVKDVSLHISADAFEYVFVVLERN